MGYRLTFGAGGPLVVQYWSSHEKLYRLCERKQNALHRPAWAAFNRRARKAPGAVGIWHETYLVERAEIDLLRHASFRTGGSHVDRAGGTARRNRGRAAW